MVEFKCLSGPMKFREGFKYQLEDDVIFGLPDAFIEFTYKTWFIQLDQCTLTLRRGYACDGPSGPTIDSRCGMRPACLHDAIYQMVREEVLPPEFKAVADQLFHAGLIHDGMGKIRAWAWYQAVKHFGKSSAIRNRDILLAP